MRKLIASVLVFSMINMSAAQSIAHERTRRYNTNSVVNPTLQETALVLNHFKDWKGVFSFLDAFAGKAGPSRILNVAVKDDPGFLSEKKPTFFVSGNQIWVHGMKPVSVIEINHRLMISYQGAHWEFSPHATWEKNYNSLRHFLIRQSTVSRSNVSSLLIPNANAANAFHFIAGFLVGLNIFDGFLAAGEGEFAWAGASFGAGALLAILVLTGGAASAEDLPPCSKVQFTCKKRQIHHMYCIQGKKEIKYNIDYFHRPSNFAQLERNGKVIVPSSKNRREWTSLLSLISKTGSQVCQHPNQNGLKRTSKGRLEIPTAAVLKYEGSNKPPWPSARAQPSIN